MKKNEKMKNNIASMLTIGIFSSIIADVYFETLGFWALILHTNIAAALILYEIILKKDINMPCATLVFICATLNCFIFKYMTIITCCAFLFYLFLNLIL